VHARYWRDYNDQGPISGGGPLCYSVPSLGNDAAGPQHVLDINQSCHVSLTQAVKNKYTNTNYLL